MARAPSPAAFDSPDPRLYPKPAILFRPLDKARLHWILPDVFTLVFEALLRPQYVIERFFLPNWTG